jgi:flagellar protein FliO/FliZ
MSAVVNKVAMFNKVTILDKCIELAPRLGWINRKFRYGAADQALPAYKDCFRWLSGVVVLSRVMLLSGMYCLSSSVSAFAEHPYEAFVENTATSTTTGNASDKTNTSLKPAITETASDMPSTATPSQQAKIEQKPQLDTVQTADTSTAPSSTTTAPMNASESAQKITTAVSAAEAKPIANVLSTPVNSSPQLRSSAALPPIHEVVIYLTLVVFAIVLLASFAKKMQLRLPGGQHFKLVATLPLGPKERLLVIEIQGKQRVLGVTAQQINFLFELESPLESDKVASNFHSQLQSWMNKSTSA